MFRACLKPVPLLARSALRQTKVAPGVFAAPGQAIQQFAARTFASKPKVEDGTLEGRYATALFMATHSRLDKVYGDLTALRSMIQESPDLKLLVETPGIDPDSKVAAIQAVCAAAGADSAVVNFLKVLVENK